MTAVPRLSAPGNQSFVSVSRKHLEHVALSMQDCFSDAEADTLNGLLAAIGWPPVEKVGSGPGRRWVPAETEEP